MARVDVTQDVVLERIVERLRDQLELDERQCYDTLEPMSPPRIPKGGEYYVTVAPGDGRFEEGEQAPGNITEEWSVLVTVFTRIALDPTDHDEKLLRDAKRGLLVLKRLILKALVGHDLATAGGDTFLRQLLYARTCSRPQTGEQVGKGGRTNAILGFITIEIGVPFDWDLTT